MIPRARLRNSKNAVVLAPLLLITGLIGHSASDNNYRTAS